MSRKGTSPEIRTTARPSASASLVSNIRRASASPPPNKGMVPQSIRDNDDFLPGRGLVAAALMRCSSSVGHSGLTGAVPSHPA